MEEINILFYVLGSFFGLTDNRIAADKTTVILYPKSQEIEIIQENLFTIIQSSKDTAYVVNQWETIIDEKNNEWTQELNGFGNKSLKIDTTNDQIITHIRFSYTDENDLRLFGIWYNSEKNQFSINHIPNETIKSKDGSLNGNYWIFKDKSTFSFTLEPFLQLAENYKRNKVKLEKILQIN